MYLLYFTFARTITKNTLVYILMRRNQLYIAVLLAGMPCMPANRICAQNASPYMECLDRGG